MQATTRYRIAIPSETWSEVTVEHTRLGSAASQMLKAKDALTAAWRVYDAFIRENGPFGSAYADAVPLRNAVESCTTALDNARAEYRAAFEEIHGKRDW